MTTAGSVSCDGEPFLCRDALIGEWWSCDCVLYSVML